MLSAQVFKRLLGSFIPPATDSLRVKREILLTIRLSLNICKEKEFLSVNLYAKLSKFDQIEIKETRGAVASK